jgi:nucleoside-diphosphate-sugar epimerase
MTEKLWRKRRRLPTSSSMRRAPITGAPSRACSARSLEAASRSSIHRDRVSSARAIFDEDTPITPSPARVARVALNEFILSHRDRGCRPVIVCPSLIYGVGLGAGPDSVQVPLLISLAKKRSNAAHAGPGENIWSNVHIDDLVTLYALAIEKAPAGAFYFAENGENSMREACEAINRMLGFAGPPAAMSMAEAAAEWGEGTTEDTMASNSRVRAKRAGQLGWQPSARGLIEEIEQGCYRE